MEESQDQGLPISDHVTGDPAMSTESPIQEGEPKSQYRWWGRSNSLQRDPAAGPMIPEETPRSSFAHGMYLDELPPLQIPRRRHAREIQHFHRLIDTCGRK